MRLSPVVLGLTSAALFGAATPASKLLLGELPPLQLAGVLYGGAALGVAPVAWSKGAPRLRALSARSARSLVGAVACGGILGPCLLLWGLARTTSGAAALLLNLELAATALLGVLLFREHLDRRGWLGIGGIVAAGMLLSGGGGLPGMLGGLLIALACLCWGLDNHFTALIDELSPAQTTFFKGLAAGSFNLAVGVALSPLSAGVQALAAGLLVGALSYGASITLYVASAQQLGPTRAQGLFAAAPFLGAGLSFVFLGEPLGTLHVAAASLLVGSIVLLQKTQHSHFHRHDETWHIHAHRHDDGHHHHEHEFPVSDPTQTHSHFHHHEPLGHDHPHAPDLHHRHEH